MVAPIRSEFIPACYGFTMLIACVQTDIRFADIPGNVSTVIETLNRLGPDGVDLAVFPECMLSGYGFESREEAMRAALTENSPEIRQIIEASARTGVSLTLGLLLRRPAPHPQTSPDTESIHNAELLINGDGIVAAYHKVHLPHLGVDRFVDRGTAPYRAWELPLRADGAADARSPARIGMAICYDSSFPEPMRALGLGGADIIALGTNWPVAASRTAEIVPPARSMENHLFFVAANRIGRERGFEYCGLSSICGPDGVELARAKGDEPVILTAEVDLRQARNKRIERTPGKHVIDRFADRRPEFYQSLTQSPETSNPTAG